MVSELGKGRAGVQAPRSLLPSSPVPRSSLSLSLPSPLSLPRRRGLVRGRRRNGIGKFASGGEGYLWAQIEAGVEILRLAAVLVCSSDFGSMPLVFAFFFQFFGAVDLGAVERQ